jgi:hypothetical protein
MLGVIRGLGKLPADDDGIEDRVLACLMVAWGEVAAMQNSERRAKLLDSLTPLGNRLVAKLMTVNELPKDVAGETGQTLADVLFASAMIAHGPAQFTRDERRTIAAALDAFANGVGFTESSMKIRALAARFTD